MIIPSNMEERVTLYSDLIAKCFLSSEDRRARYQLYWNWYIYGNDQQQTPVEYNKLFPHIDLLTSFLFSGETTTFIIEVPNVAGINFEYECGLAEQLTPRVNDIWHDSNIDLVYNDALTLALVKDTAFVKFVPQGKREFEGFVIDPSNMGVLREDIPTLSGQEAVCERFFMPESTLRRRVEHFPEERKSVILGMIKKHDEEPPKNVLPSALQTIIVNSSNPTTGEVTGETPNLLNIHNNYEPVVTENGVLCHELWVYDDNIKDYRKVEMLEGSVLLSDVASNPFIQNELPYIKVTPNQLPNYFWGRSELLYLLPLQQWVNTRIPEIKNILAKLANPPISGFGVGESKIEALLSAGGIAAFSEPSSVGKVEKHYPQKADNLFVELNAIERMFNDVSGIMEIMKGGGESGVRSGDHATLLSHIGSSRVKKRAAVLEDSVEKCATLVLKCMRRFDDTHYRSNPIKEGDKEGIPFLAINLTPHAAVKVDSHSSSPIFIEQQKDTAMMLFQAGAIDKEDLLDAVRYRNSARIKSKLKKREIAAAKAEAKEQEAENAKRK